MRRTPACASEIALDETRELASPYPLAMVQPIELSSWRRSSRTRMSKPAVAGRGVTALLVAAAGAIHLYLWFDYFHRVHVVGVLFLVNAAVGFVGGASLLATRSILVVFAAGGYAMATLAAFVVSTRWGLFGYRERFWGSWQEAAAAVELAAAVAAALLVAVSARAIDTRARSAQRFRP